MIEYHRSKQVDFDYAFTTIKEYILPHFAKSVVFRVKNLGSQNPAKLGISRHFEIGEIYD